MSQQDTEQPTQLMGESPRPEDKQGRQAVAKPSRRPILTWALIALNVAMFVLTTFGGGYSMDLFARMRLVPMSFGIGSIWTLVTSMFLHADLGHLLANMYSLYVLGVICEQMFGRRRYLITYFGGGIAGGLLFVLLRHGEAAAAVGASGAIFSLLGLYGAFLLQLRKNAGGDGKAHIQSLDAAWHNFIVILLINAVIVPMQGNIAWEGHLGGFVFGGLYGMWFIARDILRIVSEAPQGSVSVTDSESMPTTDGMPEDGNQGHGEDQWKVL